MFSNEIFCLEKILSNIYARLFENLKARILKTKIYKVAQQASL